MRASDHAVTASFIGAPGASWQAFSTSTERDSGRLSLGGTLQATKSASVFGRVVGQIGGHTADYGVQAGAEWKW
ncbi:outer membrane autotransporter (plasmid) [Burkholderia sp. YI23]|nr:outer membrane autotransporter [Burkholderia sp. YI23]